MFAKPNFDLKRKKFVLEIITYDPSIYTMEHLDLTVLNFMENSISLKDVRDLSIRAINVKFLKLNLLSHGSYRQGYVKFKDF